MYVNVHCTIYVLGEYMLDKYKAVFKSNIFLPYFFKDFSTFLLNLCPMRRSAKLQWLQNVKRGSDLYIRLMQKIFKDLSRNA